MSNLTAAFIKNKPAFIAYLTAGFPTSESTVKSMLDLQSGGADILELGVPFSDPIADGATIQKASFISLQNGTTINDCISSVKKARSLGLVVPVVLMGYYNPFYSFGHEKLVQACKDAGIDGFIIVDLPPTQNQFRTLCRTCGLSVIPLIAPTTTEDRIQALVATSDSFIYVVSSLGVTGARSEVSAELPDLIARIRIHTKLPLAVGFGVTTRDHFKRVADVADGVVIGSRIVQLMETGGDLVAFAQHVTGDKSVSIASSYIPSTPFPESSPSLTSPPLISDNFGEYGGQYAPESLVKNLMLLEKAYASIGDDFWQEFKSHYPYIGRPSPLHLASRLTANTGGARIWLKREDLNHTGSHKINNALGQVLLARRLGKTRIICETGAGQHGVATATVCAKFGLKCIVYMGAADVERQALNVFRIKLLGAAVVPVDSGSRTLKDAINEAMRDWTANANDTYYLVGSAIVARFQSVIGQEVRQEFLEKQLKLPDALVACVGGGSNAIGLFLPFMDDRSVHFYGLFPLMEGVEAGGEGINTPNHSASLSCGRPGILHGSRTYLLQDNNGQVVSTSSISAGLDYPAVGPQHAFLKDSGRGVYVAASDSEALIGMRLLAETEGILAALETCHAVFYAIELAKGLTKDKDVVICVSGRGDKDVQGVGKALIKLGEGIGWDLRF